MLRFDSAVTYQTTLYTCCPMVVSGRGLRMPPSEVQTWSETANPNLKDTRIMSLTEKQKALGWVSGSAEEFSEILGMTLDERKRAKDFYEKHGRWPSIDEVRKSM